MVTRNWDRVPVYGWYYKAPGTPDQGARLTFTITGAPHGVKRVDGRAIYRAGATQEVAVGKTGDQDPDVRNRVRQALRDRDEATLGEAFDGIAWDAAWDAALPAAVFTSFYAQDDPDVTPQGFQISVTEATSGARRTYPIDLRLAMIDATPVPGLNLADVELPAGTPVTPAPTYAKGQPGGVAPLDGDGLVPTEHLPGGGGGASTWDELTGKPTTFPPTAHNHTVSQVTGLQSALDSKAATSHNHDGTYVKPADLPAAPTWGTLSGKPAVIAAGTSATAARDAIGAGTSNLQLGTGPTTAAAGDHTHGQYATTTALTNGLAGKAASSHNHDGSYRAATWTPAVADLPAGTTLTVRYTGTTWPDRPTTRNDIAVIWLDTTGTAAAPTNPLPGDRFIQQA